jgi:hypothetical protein
MTRRGSRCLSGICMDEGVLTAGNCSAEFVLRFWLCPVYLKNKNHSSAFNQAHHFNSALAQVKPLPNAARHTRSPLWILPSCQASHKAMGTEAAVVLP